MARFDDKTIERWTVQATDWLAPRNYTCTDIVTGVDAWTVASRCGITSEAYKDRNVVDAHIQTALTRVFPRAVFKDKKRY